MLRTWRQLYCYNRRSPVPKATPYTREMVAHTKLTKEYRKKNIHEYWQQQTLIENAHIETYLEEQRLKSIRRTQTLRDFTIYKTYQDTLKHQHQQEKLKRTDELLKRVAVESDIRAMNKQQILVMLREESKTWFNGNPQWLQQNVALPEQVSDETDYYLHLQEQALYNDMGEFELLEKSLNQNTAIEWKNRLGMELFQQVVQIVKYLRQQNPYHRIKREWMVCRAALLQQEDPNMEETLSQLDSAFQTLLQEEVPPTERLERMHQQLLWLYNLVELWRRYTQVVKLNPQIADTMAREEARMRDLFGGGEKEQNVEGEEGEANQKALLSGDDKGTSSSDEEIDIEKLVSTEQTSQPEQEQGDSESQLSHNMIEKMISDSAGKSVEDTERFEELFKRSQIMYDDTDLPNAQEIYKGVDLDQIFPQEVLDAALNSTEPQLKYKSYEEVLKSEKALRSVQQDQLHSNPDIQRLQTMVLVDAIQEELDGIAITEERQGALLSQNKQLLAMIGEVRIDEPHLLLKLWRLHQ